MKKFPEEKAKFDDAAKDFHKLLEEKTKLVTFDDVLKTMFGSRLYLEKPEDKFLSFAGL